LRLTIMSSIAQDEVRKLSERVKFGFKRSIQDGKVLGNNNIYGYKKQNGKLVIDEDEAYIVRTIFELYTAGYGIRAVCNELSKRGIFNRDGNEFAFTTVKRIISNPKYKGFYCGNKTQKIAYNLPDIKHFNQSEWVMYEDFDNVPPIVSKAIWEYANLQLNKRSKEIQERNTSYTNKYVYSGKIFCSEHKCAYHHAIYKYNSGNREVWQCKIYKEKGKNECASPTLYTDELDDIVRYIIKFLKLNKSEIINEELDIIESTYGVSKTETEIARLKTKISDILKRKDRILDLNINDVITVDEFQKRNQKFNAEIKELETQISELELKMFDMLKLRNSTEKLRKIISTQFDSLESITEGLVDSLIDKIIVYKTENKNCVRLEIYLKLLGDIADFNIKRKRGKSSDIYTSLDNEDNENETSFCYRLPT
ncbi:MAG: recombinase family protein, partial [Ruminococcus sp.]|nr:recombinase family protein [Candidatus Copronaster equi]